MFCSLILHFIIYKFICHLFSLVEKSNCDFAFMLYISEYYNKSTKPYQHQTMVKVNTPLSPNSRVQTINFNERVSVVCLSVVHPTSMSQSTLLLLLLLRSNCCKHFALSSCVYVRFFLYTFILCNANSRLFFQSPNCRLCETFAHCTHPIGLVGDARDH